MPTDSREPAASLPNLLAMSKEELVTLLSKTLLGLPKEQLIALLAQTLLVQQPALAPAANAVDWSAVKKKCSKCGESKLVLPDFGLTKHRGKVGPQGWCRACRAGTSWDYREKPRKKKG
jgi:hypothetical protein